MITSLINHRSYEPIKKNPISKERKLDLHSKLIDKQIVYTKQRGYNYENDRYKASLQIIDKTEAIAKTRTTIAVNPKSLVDSFTDAVIERYFNQKFGVVIDPSTNEQKGDIYHYVLMGLIHKNDRDLFQAALSRVQFLVTINASGLMPWLVDTNGWPIDIDGATDIDLGIIEFLMAGYEKFESGVARDLAIKQINTFWEKEVYNNKLLLGNNWGTDNNSKWNHSYSLYGTLIRMKLFEEVMKSQNIGSLNGGHDYSTLINNMIEGLKLNNEGFSLGVAHDFNNNDGTEFSIPTHSESAIDYARIPIHCYELLKLSSITQVSSAFGSDLEESKAIAQEFCNNFITHVFTKVSGSTDAEKAINGLKWIADLTIDGEQKKFDWGVTKNAVVWSGYLAAIHVATPQLITTVENELFKENGAFLKTDSEGIPYFGTWDGEVNYAYNQSIMSYALDCIYGNKINTYSKIVSISDNLQISIKKESIIKFNPKTNTVVLNSPIRNISIFSTQGKIVQKHRNLSKNSQLNLNELSPGIYLIRAISKNGEIHKGKISIK